MVTIDLNGQWNLLQQDYAEGRRNCADLPTEGWLPATVPGDVYNDLRTAGKIPDPYYADNVYQCGTITEKDSFYRRTFELAEADIHPHMLLEFLGIDTFSEVFLNGNFLGETENMFLKYSFDVSQYVHAGRNELIVCIRSIKNRMKQYPETGYFGCFNVQRIFIRKAQCHFSWDWAPDFPATGIWDDVRLCGFDNGCIEDVQIRTAVDGVVSFFVNLDKKYLPDTALSPWIQLKITDGRETWEIEAPVHFGRARLTTRLPSPRLWWPRDMGEPFLYSYTLDYQESGKTVQTQNGRFGIREVHVEEKPQRMADGLSCGLVINGEPVFFKGANWVPLDIMTGCVTLEKYRHALEMAVRADFNCLRVWGGGIYEKQCFYDLCDELGLLVWQDLAFACADIPDDYPGFNETVIPEIEYQVQRLRNHACLALWCGGNEKTGEIGKNKSRGDHLVNYTLRGIVGHLDPSHPYFSSSPWSYSGDGNAQDSGDCHCNSYQKAMTSSNVSNFRNELMKFTAPLASEIAVQGCSSERVLRTFLPKEMLWPINKMWDLHMTRNPYDGTGTTFAQQQEAAAGELFGKVVDLSDFVKKSMTVHSEFVRADIEYHRSRKGDCGGAMLWMYSDVWPCGTWAIVDYDMTPKAAYYSAKRVNRPIHAAIVQKKNGIQFTVVNDTLRAETADFRFGQMTLDGEILSEGTLRGVIVEPVKATELAAEMPEISSRSDSFLFLEMTINDETERSAFFPNLWHDVPWPESGLAYTVEEKSADGCRLRLRVSCQKYARMVDVDFENIRRAFLSDNYFDLLPGEVKTVTIESDEPVALETLTIKDWVSVGREV